MAITTTRDRVRLEIGDTDNTAPLFYDDEIDAYLGDRGDNWHLAAADLCDVLATKFAREFDFETDQQKFSRSQRSKQYADRAKALRARVSSVGTATSTRVDGYSQDIDNEDASTAAASSNTGRVRSGYFNDDVPY